MNLSGESYLPSLSKLSSQITWLTFATLIIIGTNSFLLYRFHFGVLNPYKERLEYDEKNSNVFLSRYKGAHPEESPEIAETTVRNWLRDNHSELTELQKQTRVITLPLLGIPLIERDFFILFLIIGVIFLLWLFTLLKYTKSFLETLLNEYHYPSDSDANTIQSLFFLIMPGDYTAKRFGYFEWIFLLFIASIGLLIVSDANDIFFRLTILKTHMYQEPTFKFFKAHLISTYGIILLCLAMSIVLYWNAKRTLRHIRNTLILLRWNRTGFVPVLYDFAKERNKPLGKKRNFIEYRVCDDANDSKLVILLTQEDGTNHEFKASVDLPNSMRRFYKNHKISRTEFDQELERLLTIEESFMRSFFRRILRDDSYEKELRGEISKLG